MAEKKLLLRGTIINEIRFFFSTLKYLEVETPCRIPTPAPETNIDMVESDGLFLHTSPELCMKRLLADGYEKIFQICRCFRDNERGKKHLPEFTLLEWYWAGADYLQMMVLTEALIKKVALGIGIKGLLIYQGDKINLNCPWEKLTVKEAFNKFASITMEQAISQNLFNEILAFEIEPNLGRKKPLFLFDYPEVFGSLARLKPDNNLFAERFELYISGLELCNGFSELTDHQEQRKRFEKELVLRKLSGKKNLPMPEKFLKSLKKMPEAAGNALGIDRLVMLFANAGKIDEVVAFTPEEL
ncbi:MAG TPA: EF-P lysine aminoacylase GenX [Desulfobacteraceae bacterium]|nr:EF-P lysine aminoacylase GenX [Desulfobacteraceae bacterium]